MTTANEVLFESEEQLATCRRDFLTRGALMVTPDGELKPLATLDITVRGPALEGDATLTCQVVSLQPGRALLQIEGQVPPLLSGASPASTAAHPFASPAAGQAETPINPFAAPPDRAVAPNPFATPPADDAPRPNNPFAKPPAHKAPQPVAAPPESAVAHNPFATPPVDDAPGPNNPFAKPPAHKAPQPVAAPPESAVAHNPFATPPVDDAPGPNNPFAKPPAQTARSSPRPPSSGVPSLVRGAILRFLEHADLEHAAEALRLHGVVLAHVADGDAPQSALRLALGSHIDADPQEVAIRPHPSGAVLVTFAQVDGVAAAADRLLALAPEAFSASAPAAKQEAPFAATAAPPALATVIATHEEVPVDAPPPASASTVVEAPFVPAAAAAASLPPPLALVGWEDSLELGDGTMPPPSLAEAPRLPTAEAPFPTPDGVADDIPLAASAEPAPDDVPLAAPTEPVADDIPLAAPAEPIPDDIPLAAPAEPIADDIPLAAPAEPAADDIPLAAPSDAPAPDEATPAVDVEPATGDDAEPRLDGTRLLLLSDAAVRRWRADLETLGAAQVSTATPGDLPAQIAIVVADGEPLGPFAVQALPAGAATILQPADAAAVLAALDREAVNASEVVAPSTADAVSPDGGNLVAPADETPVPSTQAPDTSATPPTIEGDALIFATMADLCAAKKDISDVGALLARSVHPTQGERTLFIKTADQRELGAHKASLQPMGGDQFLVQWADAATLLGAIDRASAADAPAATPKAARAPQPPTLVDGVLRFDLPQDLDHAAGDLIQHGATLARGEGAGGPVRLSVRLAIGGGQGPDTLDVTTEPAGADQVVVQFVDRAALPEALSRVPRNVAAAKPRQGAQKDFALSGPYRVPTTAAEILRIPLIRPPTDEEIERPTLPLLIRGLTTRPGNWRLTMEPAGHAPCFVVLRDQKLALGLRDFGDIGRDAARASGYYQVTEQVENTPLSHRSSLIGLMAELVAGIIGTFDYDALDAGLQEKAKMAPMLNAQGNKLIDALPFTGGQARVAKRRMDGKLRVHDIVNGPSGQRAGWEAVYLLETFGCLDWFSVDGHRKVVRAKRLSAARMALNKVEDKDHFTRLGLHWSCAPRMIKPAVEAARKRFGPGSDAAKEDPDSARKMLELAEEAYATLSDPGKRRQYRKATFTLVWSQHADLMVSHAKLALYRGDVEEARDTLEGIADFHQHPEAASMLRKLRQKLDGG